MAAKLVIALIVLTIIVALVVAATFLYFREKEKHNHEKEMRRMDRDEAVLAGDSIDRELERDRNE